MEPLTFHDGRVELYADDCLAILKLMPDCFVDAVITDPPYHLTSIVKRFGGENAVPAGGRSNMESGEVQPPNRGAQFKRLSRGFMGQQWDGGDIAFRPDVWRECLRVLKPGGHMASFSGTRTYHRMACAIEDAGFEIRDQLAWTYGSGFPKSHDVSKGIDKAAGAEREKRRFDASEVGNFKGRQDTRPWIEKAKEQGLPATDAAREWQGWGTALKPAWEPICLARKPLSEGTVAANVLRWGTGAINVDACRVATDESTVRTCGPDSDHAGQFKGTAGGVRGGTSGRFPANLVHDGSPEVLAGFPETTSGKPGNSIRNSKSFSGIGDSGLDNPTALTGFGDSGSAARFFYCAKANKKDRAGSNHPTVKPISLIAWLVRMLTPPGGLVLDPFAGTGTLAAATFQENKRAILIEREELYRADIVRRVEALAA